MLNKPEISVIITAYNRKKYLKEAISSALNQTFPRDSYEVIVIKNFYDDDVDNFIRENNVKSIYTEEEKSGGMFKLGIEQSSGEIICFLDDDDKFHEDKLRKVHESFEKYKDLGFYHNNRIVIDEDGKVIVEPKPWGEEYIDKYDKSVYESLIRREAWNNNSSICVRRDCVDLQELGQINIAIDIYFLSKALINKAPLLLDHTPLTYYRVHSSNTSIGFYDVSKRYKFKQKDTRDLFRIYEISKRNKEFNQVFYYYRYLPGAWRYNIIYEDKRLEVLIISLRMLIKTDLPLKLKVMYVGASLLNLVFHNYVRNYLLRPDSHYLLNYLLRLDLQNVKKIAELAIDR
ncbi:MAG: cell wall biosynthesis glycosyltransferase [Candidatus Aramenus sulfurataquae]|jgi:glycosyltransferase involved in cell wall biosynthesis|uniref:Cell wall biosynthesis glycosyltransferase n=2 Tax=Candidatus Aramenus sulfurataquae TaxID=1326980 RepID=W7KT40_9CREN|nr:MAG: cell wall biosynthesis glycosyltransferase [Candidatus Aramenus sulfurataquae]MCL7344652.1 glycosyltransferase family 2 protein [Candidatus Aramenus sulfurataquae]